MAPTLIIFYPLLYLSGKAASPITLKMVVHRTSPGLLCYLCARTYDWFVLRACIDLRVIHSSGKAPRLTPAQLIAEQPLNVI